jgi:diguanylate cyclase (GGDEF)-like protein
MVYTAYMAKQSHVRIRIVLALLVMFALLVFAAFYLVFGALKSSMSSIQRSFYFTAINLARMYSDLRYPGSWEAREGVLYKGDTRMSGNQEVTQALAVYLPPEIRIEFGVGVPAVSLTRQQRPLYESLLFMRRQEEPGSMTPPPPDIPTFSSTGAFLGLRGSDGSVVGWLFSGQDRNSHGAGRSGLLQFLLVAGSVASVLVTLGLSVIVLWLSKPIDKIVEAHGRVVRRNVELYNRSRTDPLTGLLNRRGFLEVANEEMRTAAFEGDAYVAIVDVDHFKQVNDTRGHECGDAALVGLAGVLQNGVRKQDYCARWGGEEFVALLTGVDAETAERSTQRLRSAVEQHPFACSNQPFSITVTIGLARLDAIDALSQAIERADQALYQGKQAGRNQVVMAP